MGKIDYEKKLQKVIKHARKEPDTPTARITALYEVNVRTLGRQFAGTSRDYATAARDKQLFDVGEERAIAEHAGMMADAGFPLTYELLRGIAQHIVNERQMPQKGHRGGLVGKKASITNPQLRAIASSTSSTSSVSSSTSSTLFESTPPGPLHIVGIHWVDRFLKRNTGFKKTYVRFQERARAAASNDIELQDDFLRKLGNLLRRKDISPNNIWNCDEKGIIMGRNGSRTMAIVRAGGRSTARIMMEGSREFCSVLESVSAAGVVIPPFIVWQGKSHRESYYTEGGLVSEATFAISDSGYIDDELGFEFMKEHFEPHTRNPDNAPRCLIVDGHSSHLTWKVVQFALDHNIHMICLPSKSTHLLQPLDIGCFGILQNAYSRNLTAWLRQNPNGVITKPIFLDILGKTRPEVYTEECILAAWRNSRCHPINRERTPTPAPAESGLVDVSDPTLDKIRALDTPT